MSILNHQLNLILKQSMRSVRLADKDLEAEKVTFQVNTSKAEVQTRFDFRECAQLPSESKKMMWV